MIPYRQVRQIITATVAALVLVGLSFTSAYAWGIHWHHHPSVPANATFTISSAIYTAPAGAFPAPSCTGSIALLYPGVTRCMVFTVHNDLSRPITVESIASALSSSFPAPPAVCAGSNLSLPAFSGSLVVPAGATALVPGLPISLKESHSNQDACKNLTYHFTYTGTAIYTDATSIALTSSPEPSTFAKPVTFTAQIAAASASTDTSLPTGLVTFLECSTSSCASSTPLGTGTIGKGGQATYTTTSLPVGTNYVEAVYAGAGTDYTGSTSNVVTQVVRSTLTGTSTVLTTSPNPSFVRDSVSLTATVASLASPLPHPVLVTGTVDFFTGTPTGAHTLIGSAPLNAGETADIATSSLPLGTTNLYAVYVGTPTLASSSSPSVTQLVIARVSGCNGNYARWWVGGPGWSSYGGSNRNSFFYVPSGSYHVDGQNGNDCFDGGDGNNWFNDGNGSVSVYCGNGGNHVTLGDGDDSVNVGNGANTIWAGNGDDEVSVGNGNHNQLTFGNGNDSVTLGSGSQNQITLGSGTDVVTIQGGGQDVITGGRGNEKIYLGVGTDQTYDGASRQSNVCYLPAPPSSWHGTAAAYYHDTLTNCTVVS